MSDVEDTDEFDHGFFQSNQQIIKQNKYIQENLSEINYTHNSLINKSYLYKVGMTFNNKLHIQNSGLNPTKRGRPKVDIEFVKNSSLFDKCKVNPNWIEQDMKKWAK